MAKVTISEDALLCLALHLAGATLNSKNRRLWDLSGSFGNFAELVLGRNFRQKLRQAHALLENLSSDFIVTFADADYPPLLAEIHTAPFALFLRGNRAILQKPTISLVGTREPSAAGRMAAYRIAQQFAFSGKTIVSGIARGIDAIAHHAALQAGSSTCAVLPNGFNHTYPLENRDIYALAKESDRVLLVSEYLPDEKPQKFQFVRRNRLIAGLSGMTVVVEAGLKSGALITVQHALDEGRDVGALSHPSLANNAGGEKLIAEGAINLTGQVFPLEGRRQSR